MSISSPVIIVPTDLGSFRTTSKSQLISGTFVSNEASTVKYRYDIISSGTSEEPTFNGPLRDEAMTIMSSGAVSTVSTDVPWSFNASYLNENLHKGKTLCLAFYSVNEGTGEVSIPSYIQMVFTTIADRITSAPTPTGVEVRRNNAYLEVSCSEVDTSGYNGTFLGYNFYVATVAGGGVQGYSLINSSYVTTPSGVRTVEVPTSNTVSSSGGVSVETTVTTAITSKEYSSQLTGGILNKLTASSQLTNSTYDVNTTFYFTVTSLMYDNTLGYVVESPYSVEVSGRFLNFAAVYNQIPERNRDQIVSSLIRRVLGVSDNASLMPTTVYKDLLDPVSEEFASYYVIQDFLAQTESFRTLMMFDDENGDGFSDPVNASVKKSKLMAALKVSNTDVVQNLINSFFDLRASNHEITRMGAVASTGTATLYASDIPVEGLLINDGSVISTGSGYSSSGGSVRFLIRGTRKMYYSTKSTYYNSVTKRYEIEVDIIAYVPGALGNVSAGAITQMISGCDPRLKVVNNAPTYGGADTESNLSLANRAQLAIAGLDTGTRGGYLLKALGVPGVRSAKVVQAGDDMMVRDIDPDTGRHLGGKVDIYVETFGTEEKQDTIAFSYNGPAGANAGERFYVEDASNFLIRTTNPLVTPATPIFEVIKVVNVTRSKSYDLSGVVAGLGDGDSIQLSLNTWNLTVGLATKDVIEVDYRYRGSNTYVLDNQPVERIVSVVGDIDGALPTSSFSLVKLEDPLQLGNSTQARDGVVIQFYNGFPSESTRQVNSEPHPFFSTNPIKLAKKGVDTDTIMVTSDENGIFEYDKDTDYTIGRGGQEGYTYLYLQPYSKIRSGSLVYVSYQHSQNLSVTYTVNGALSRVQTVVNQFKHGVADAVVKGCIRNEVDIYLKVIREKGYSESSIVAQIQTILGNFISSQKVGQGVNMDDVIKLVKNIKGVRTLSLPIARMMKKNGSLIDKDYLGYVDFKVYSTNAGKGITSYISVDPVLNYGTIEGGGPTGLFRGVYEGEQALVSADSPLNVSIAAGRSYIRSDGRIIVSTFDGTPPQTHEYWATYYTYVAPGEEFASDLEVMNTESLVVGSDSITVDASTET